MISVTIDRSSLSKPDLVISDDLDATYLFTPSGLGYVVQSVRTTSAPVSPFISKTPILAAVLEGTGLPLQFHVLADSTAGLNAAVAEVVEALFRIEYPVTRTVDGQSVTYLGGPAAVTPVRDSVEWGVVAQHFDTFSTVIPFPDPVPVS